MLLATVPHQLPSHAAQPDDLQKIESTHNCSRCDLSRANFQGADLDGADLSSSDLSLANLVLADLSHTNLSHAVMIGADCREAILWGADLRFADLSGVDFRGAVYDRNTKFDSSFDPIEAGMMQFGRDL